MRTLMTMSGYIVNKYSTICGKHEIQSRKKETESLEWEKLAGFPSYFCCLHKTKLNLGMDPSLGGHARSVSRNDTLVVDEVLRIELCLMASLHLRLSDILKQDFQCLIFLMRN